MTDYVTSDMTISIINPEALRRAGWDIGESEPYALVSGECDMEALEERLGMRVEGVCDEP